MTEDAREPNFLVGVFQHQRKRGISLMAYTRYYNPTWEGCCVHPVSAVNGTEAKRLAMAEHRVKCMGAKPSTEPTPERALVEQLRRGATDIFPRVYSYEAGMMREAADLLSRLGREHRALREAVETAILTANEAYTAWDADQDSRVGKLLAALAGRRKGYRAEIDAIHAVLASSSPAGGSTP